eukprot:Rmarinus@m.17160
MSRYDAAFVAIAVRSGILVSSTIPHFRIQSRQKPRTPVSERTLFSTQLPTKRHLESPVQGCVMTPSAVATVLGSVILCRRPRKRRPPRREPRLRPNTLKNALRATRPLPEKCPKSKRKHKQKRSSHPTSLNENTNP